MLWPRTLTVAVHFLDYFAAALDISVSIRDQARSAALALGAWCCLVCSRGAGLGDLGRSFGDWCLGGCLAGDILAASSRLCAARELGFRLFSWANSRGCWVATWARRPAA